MHKTIILCTLLCLLAACKVKETTGNNEGTITYKIIYPEIVKGKAYASFLPTKMISAFKNHNYKVTIKGDLSLYDLEYICKANGDSSATLFRVFDKRLFRLHKADEPLFLFGKLDETDVEFTDSEPKVISGYMCKKAIIHLASPETTKLTVYYTEDIDFHRPPENTPFDKIPGAMLEFQVPFKGWNLTFSAQNVEHQRLEKKIFDVPDNYKASEKGEIAELVSALIQ
ncbi:MULTISPECIES: hypothetical protein [unclassified Carboxylicivirga]|uniref:hypothetical protein n=1 Tax=Carboxylicivirga TaxID=1628153 RepID=UPI003D341F95